MAKSNFRGPLTSLNVIDFGHYYAGPMAAMLLADQGANVIRIVRPGSKELPEQQYRLLNRNKKLLELDLKTEEGKSQALSLIEKADVLIENFRPGVMKRLGLDYACVKKTNPGLVYLSLPGFSSTDKERANLQAWEGVLSAAACVYTNTSVFRDFLAFPPVYTAVPHCSIYGGVNGATAIMAALVAREKYGRGTLLEVPLVSAGLTAFDALVLSKPPLWNMRADPHAPDKLPPAFDGCTFLLNDDRAIQEEKTKAARAAYFDGFGLFRPYRCADDREIYLYPMNKEAPGSWVFYEALGIDQQLKDEGFVMAGPYETHIHHNLNLFHLLNDKRKQRVLRLIQNALLKKTADEWEDILGPVISATKIRTRDEWLKLDAMLDSGVLVKMDNGTSSLTVPGRLVDIGTPRDIAFQEPVFIEYSQALDVFSAATARRKINRDAPLLQKGDLLKGIKVLDMARMVAGPSVSMQLALYGADVISAFPTEAKHFHGMMAVTNVGKRSIVLDPKTEPGRAIVQQLVTQSHAVVHNCLDGSSQRSGLNHEHLRAINPQIITCQVSAFGGTWRNRGGWEKRRGVEQTAQAPTGIMMQYGTKSLPQIHGQVSCADTLGGPAGAFAVLLGLYQKLTTGQAVETRTSLARFANYIQLPYMIAENGHSDWGEARGQFAVGEHWWQRLYQCRDGWIYVGTSEQRARQLVQTVVGQQTADHQTLETAFAIQDCDFWLRQLNKAHIACHRVINVEDLLSQSETSTVNNRPTHKTAQGSTEVHCWKDHPCGYPFTFLAPDFVRVGEQHSYWQVSPAPRLGEHTRQILKELGHSDDEIADLIRLKIAHDYFPMLGSKNVYLPGLSVKKSRHE